MYTCIYVRATPIVNASMRETYIASHDAESDANYDAISTSYCGNKTHAVKVTLGNENGTYIQMRFIGFYARTKYNFFLY